MISEYPVYSETSTGGQVASESSSKGVQGSSLQGAKKSPGMKRKGGGINLRCCNLENGLNMQLLLVSGFLGTGKTTFIIGFAKFAIQKGVKVAILVNEIGEIGIDDQLMRRLGLNVWEILGGCICCTLAGSLNETLDKLLGEYKPDLVLLEPSGAADLRNVIEIVAIYEKRALMKTRKMVIVDPLRLPMLMEVLTPLITSQIQSAELVLINKKDLATPKELETALQTVSDIHPDVKILCTSVKEDLDPEIIDELLP